jgi:hypothetical protein
MPLGSASFQLVQWLFEPRKVRIALYERREKERPEVGDRPAPLLPFVDEARHVVERVGDVLGTLGIAGLCRPPEPRDASVEEFE